MNAKDCEQFSLGSPCCDCKNAVYHSLKLEVQKILDDIPSSVLIDEMTMNAIKRNFIRIKYNLEGLLEDEE